ncbi:formyltransferase family protein [Leptospira yasudae]|uniref:formyltransferase family protein n=1 Tax=Leptospira yasudae TaxID=2202201 RepID=UPI001FC917B5|nr:formyltransferase family protein [Leptospira yasudae]
MEERLIKNLKPNIVILTSRTWNEWIAFDEKVLAVANPILIRAREDFNLSTLNEISPDFIFVPHWSFLIPAEIHDRYKTIIFHMTDLPYGRGGSPLQNLISAGHKRTKITAIQCVKGMDAGPVYLKEDLDLFGSAEEIFIRASKIIHSMILTILEKELKPIPQIGEVTTFSRRKPEQSDLNSIKDFSEDQVYDFIRMLDAPGYPRAYVRLGGYKIEFSKVFRTEDGLQGIFNIKKA